MHYSLYYENFKNDEFESAKGDLEWIIDNAPGFPSGDDRNFERHVELFEGLAQQAATEDQRLAYLDTAATLLASATERMEKHGVSYEGYAWEIRKGRFLQEHEDALPKLDVQSLKDPRTHYRKAFSMAPEKIDPYYIQQGLRGYLENNQQQQALEFLNEVDSKRGDDNKVSKIVSSVRNDIFGKNPQAKVNYLEKQLKANPDSAQVMLSLFNAYVRQGNISKASELAPRLMKTNPPAETVREIAEMRLENGRAKEALQAYDKAIEQGAELKPQDYLNRGNAYTQMGSFSKARREYRKALDMQPEFGQAYLAIGDLYANAVNECSGGQLGRKDKAVYWAAVDKYRQAIDADSTLASLAKSKIQSYRDVFPTQEDIFYREDWSAGESFTIDYGCYSWIGETTTVRQAP
jgi:tetratricopeptide (TPR) repeat protein